MDCTARSPTIRLTMRSNFCPCSAVNSREIQKCSMRRLMPIPDRSLKHSRKTPASRSAFFLPSTRAECRNARSAGPLGRGNRRISENSRDQSAFTGRPRAPRPRPAGKAAAHSRNHWRKPKRISKPSSTSIPIMPMQNTCWARSLEDANDSSAAIAHSHPRGEARYRIL